MKESVIYGSDFFWQIDQSAEHWDWLQLTSVFNIDIQEWYSITCILYEQISKQGTILLPDRVFGKLLMSGMKLASIMGGSITGINHRLGVIVTPRSRSIRVEPVAMSTGHNCRFVPTAPQWIISQTRNQNCLFVELWRPTDQHQSLKATWTETYSNVRQ